MSQAREFSLVIRADATKAVHGLNRAHLLICRLAVLTWVRQRGGAA